MEDVEGGKTRGGVGNRHRDLKDYRVVKTTALPKLWSISIRLEHEVLFKQIVAGKHLGPIIRLRGCYSRQSSKRIEIHGAGAALG
jgi:hypothetical protein